jgi:L-arabinose isomerase
MVEDFKHFADIDFPGVCTSHEQVDEALRNFEADGKDLVIVVLLTYAPSHIALRGLTKTSLPILILNTQQLTAVTPQTSGDDTTRNHGMHGVQDLANVLLRAGRDFHIVTGHYRDPRTVAEVRAWCDAARVVRKLHETHIGLVGYAMEGMGDFGLDETAFLTQTGVEVHHLSMRTLAERAQAAPAQIIADSLQEDRGRFQFDPEITEDEYAASARLEWAMRQLLDERGMQGFASHFMAVGEEGLLETLPFLASSKLLADGYGFGGEGDVTSATAVCMMQALAGEANFTEMFTMDFEGNAALMMHMGEANWRMARPDEPIHLVRSTIGSLFDVKHNPLLLAFSLKPGDVTLLSLTTVQNGRLRMIATEGKVLDFRYVPDLARPHYKFRPDGELPDFLTRYSQAGGSHHQALAYGRWADTIEKVALLTGIEYARI